MDSGERKEKKEEKKNRDKNKKTQDPKNHQNRVRFTVGKREIWGSQREKNKNWFIRGTPHVSAFNSFEPLFWS